MNHGNSYFIFKYGFDLVFINFCLLIFWFLFLDFLLSILDLLMDFAYDMVKLILGDETIWVDMLLSF